MPVIRIPSWGVVDKKDKTTIESILFRINNIMLTKKVIRIIKGFEDRLNSLKTIELNHRDYFMKFLIADTVKNIKKCRFNTKIVGYDSIESHVLNVVWSLFRKEKEEVEKLKKHTKKEENNNYAEDVLNGDMSLLYNR